MPKKRKTKYLEGITYEELRVRQWITNNRGILNQIAVHCDCSPQFVQQLAYGRSTALSGNPVEMELRKRGWPGVRRKG